MSPTDTWSRAVAAMVLGLVCAACGTTVPVSQQVMEPGSAVPAGSVLPSGQGTASRQAGEPGLAPEAPAGRVPEGRTLRPATAGTGSQGATTSVAAGPAATGFGWDQQNIYIGVPTADDFNQVVKNAGANFNNGDVHGDFDALVKDINSKGGVLGRKLVVVYHDASSADYSSNPGVVAQAMCSFFTQDRPVVAVVNGSPQLDAQPNFHSCLEKHDVTLVSLTNTVYSDKDYLQLGPHLFSGASLSTDKLIPTFVSALDRRAFFTSWDTTLGQASPSTPVKVGLLLPDDPAGHYVGSLFKTQLGRIGKQVAKEYYYPPSGGGSESQQEVLAFSAAKVTHVLDLPPVELEIALFQRQAENQRYRPRYGYTVFDLPLTVEENPAVAPPAQQIGSMGIGWQPLNDVNARHDVGDMPGGKRCFATLAAGGQSFDDSSRRAKFAGALACDAMYLLRDAMVQARGLTGDQLLAAMPVVGPKFLPASTFGSVLSDHGLPGYYRDSAYNSGCSCFVYSGPNRPF